MRTHPVVVPAKAELQRVGGGYQFVHGAFMERFAGRGVELAAHDR
jgi:hypothetical protein